MSMQVRLATEVDAQRIAEIYSQGIADRIATFETEPRSADDIVTQLRHKGERYPTIVVELDGEVVGYASAGEYRSRECYAGIAEHSVYVDRAARGRGVGKIALDALCAEYARRGFWKLVSRIFPENEASLRIHRDCGFRKVGTYERHAKLDGEWRDCVIVERSLP